jgi:hypothetical protein
MESDGSREDGRGQDGAVRASQRWKAIRKWPGDRPEERGRAGVFLVSWTGNWKIVPGDDAYDDARDEFNAAVVEIVICCVPIPGGVAASGTRFCARATGRILKTRRGHYILEYIWNGRKHYAHMPGWNFIGDKVCDKGVQLYLTEVVRRSPGFWLRYPERIADAKCVKNCFWTVVSATCRGL